MEHDRRPRNVSPIQFSPKPPPGRPRSGNRGRLVPPNEFHNYEQHGKETVELDMAIKGFEDAMEKMQAASMEVPPPKTDKREEEMEENATEGSGTQGDMAEKILKVYGLWDTELIKVGEKFGTYLVTYYDRKDENATLSEGYMVEKLYWSHVYRTEKKLPIFVFFSNDLENNGEEAPEKFKTSGYSDGRLETQLHFGFAGSIYFVVHPHGRRVFQKRFKAINELSSAGLRAYLNHFQHNAIWKKEFEKYHKELELHLQSKTSRDRVHSQHSWHKSRKQEQQEWKDSRARLRAKWREKLQDI